MINELLDGRHNNDGGPAGTDSTDEVASPSYPHCGKDLDPDLEFCHWCTTPLEEDGGEDESATDASPDDAAR